MKDEKTFFIEISSQIHAAFIGRVATCRRQMDQWCSSNNAGNGRKTKRGWP